MHKQQLFYIISICLLLFFTACQPPTPEAVKPSQPTINFDQKLKSLGIELPPITPPVANYVNAVVTTHNLVFLAGKGPKKSDGKYLIGKLGDDLTIEQGYEAARISGINQLAALKAEIGDFNRVKRIVKVHGMVNATPDFTEHSKVMNGFSDLMVEVFGDKGKHARAAVGMGSLPFGMAVEVEMIVELK